MHLNSVLLFALSLTNSLSNALAHKIVRRNEAMAMKGLLPNSMPKEISDEMASIIQRRKFGAELQPQGLIQEEWARLPLDHWDSNAGTFLNRFWVSDAYYKPGGPVFIFDWGEQGASDSALDPDWFLGHLMQKFNGMGISWEHRYYGASTPVKISASTPASAFEFLDTEQALADIPTFAWNFSRPNFPNIDLTPGSTPWIFIGGSYPGMRAAFVRHMYPETIYASYAASAPVQASIDMSFYFEPVWQGLNKIGLGNCAADIHAAILAVDEMLDDEHRAFTIKEKFLGPGGGQNSNGNFADALGLILSGWQDKGVATHLNSFCRWISEDPETKKTSDSRGWAVVKGANFTIDRWLSWEDWVPLLNGGSTTPCLGPNSNATGITPTGAPNCKLEQKTNDPDSISWMWQYCTQWGYFQSANLGEHQLVSKYNSLEHFKEGCHLQFPDGLQSGLLPEWPKVDETNERYGGWKIRPSNTYWTAGMFDPWRTLSTLSDMPFSPKNKPVETIPECSIGDADDESPIFGYVIPDAEHCADFNTNPATLPVQQLFDQALTKWLGCYAPPGHNKISANSRYTVKTGIRRVTYP